MIGVENRNCLQLKPCHMSLNIRVGIMWDLLTSDIVAVKVTVGCHCVLFLFSQCVCALHSLEVMSVTVNAHSDCMSSQNHRH